MLSKSEINHLFGQSLRELREVIGISQEELAFRCGLHRTYISLLERGVRTPSLDVVFRICEALDTPPEEIVAQVRRRSGWQ